MGDLAGWIEGGRLGLRAQGRGVARRTSLLYRLLRRRAYSTRIRVSGASLIDIGAGRPESGERSEGPPEKFGAGARGAFAGKWRSLRVARRKRRRSGVFFEIGFTGRPAHSAKIQPLSLVRKDPPAIDGKPPHGACLLSLVDEHVSEHMRARPEGRRVGRGQSRLQLSDQRGSGES